MSLEQLLYIKNAESHALIEQSLHGKAMYVCTRYLIVSMSARICAENVVCLTEQALLAIIIPYRIRFLCQRFKRGAGTAEH